MASGAPYPFDRLSPQLQGLLPSLGITAPTEAQLAAVPRVLQGENLLLIAPTGMGKTEAAIDTYRLILGSVDTHCMQAMHALVRIYKKLGKAELARAMEQRARRMSTGE